MPAVTLCHTDPLPQPQRYLLLNWLLNANLLHLTEADGQQAKSNSCTTMHLLHLLRVVVTQAAIPRLRLALMATHALA